MNEGAGCAVCGSRTCTAHPDIAVHDTYPFLPAEGIRMENQARAEAAEPKRDVPVKGKRRPVNDRARKLDEDRAGAGDR